MHHSLANRHSCRTSAKGRTTDIQSTETTVEGRIHRYTVAVYLADVHIASICILY